MMTKNIEELKEKLKEGTISYFSLTQGEIESLTESLKQDIKKDEEEIDIIKNKIDIEKRKLENFENKV